MKKFPPPERNYPHTYKIDCEAFYVNHFTWRLIYSVTFSPLILFIWKLKHTSCAVSFYILILSQRSFSIFLVISSIILIYFFILLNLKCLSRIKIYKLTCKAIFLQREEISKGISLFTVERKRQTKLNRNCIKKKKVDRCVREESCGGLKNGHREKAKKLVGFKVMALL